MVLPQPKDALPEVKHLSLSPQGRFLAASRGNKIELWDFIRRKLLRIIPSTGGGALAFSPEEKWLAVAGYSGKISINEVPNGRTLASFPVADGNDTVYETKFSADSTQLVVGGMLGKGPERKGLIQIWNVADVLSQTRGAHRRR